MRSLLHCILIAALLPVYLSVALSQQRIRDRQLSASPAWGLGPFTRPAALQPVLTAQPASTFPDPILGTPVHWEALHTFNPAAVVRDGKVALLYRAEDASGAMQIGMHTSRLGLAASYVTPHKPTVLIL